VEGESKQGKALSKHDILVYGKWAGESKGKSIEESSAQREKG